MAQKTSGEFEKEFVDGIKATTGKDLGSWMKVLDGFGSKKRPEVIARLKSDHGFGHMNAAMLAAIHANGGKLVYQSTDNLLDTQFAKAEPMPAFRRACGIYQKEHPERDGASEEDLRFDPR